MEIRCSTPDTYRKLQLPQGKREHVAPSHPFCCGGTLCCCRNGERHQAVLRGTQLQFQRGAG